MARFFSIPKPCSENWNEMNATEQGAFCGKCTKEVIDCSSLKSGEIKEAMESTTDPCVKIFSSQIDEMNFLEWFKSLTVKVQLKYAFLFAFLLVFNTNGKTQDTTNTLPEIINEEIIDDTVNLHNNHIAVDSNHLSHAANITNDIPLNDTTLTDTSAQIQQTVEKDASTLVINEEVVIWEPDDNNKVVICEISHTLGFMIMGDWIEEPLAKPALSPFSPTLLDTLPPYEIITNSNNLTLSNSRYSFNIVGDTLHFMAYALESEQIKITITKKGHIHPTYFNPIQIEQGRSEFDFSLHDFESGSYIITVEEGYQRKGIELIYW